MSYSAPDPVLATRAAYEADADAWTRSHESRASLAPRYAAFRALLPVGARVLDLGCGPGLDASELAARGLDVRCLDIAAAMLAIALRAPATAGRGVRGDSRALPFRPASFEGVWASASLLHLPKIEVGGALAEVARVLRPGGVFYTAMKEGEHDGFVPPPDGGPVRAERYFAHYRREEWGGLLRAAGFEALEQLLEGEVRRPGDTLWIVTLARKP